MIIPIRIASLLIVSLSIGPTDLADPPPANGSEEGVFNQYHVFKEWFLKWNEHYHANAYENPPKSKDRPAFCTVYDCPKFWTLCNGTDFEVRSYGPITWAYSEVQSISKIMAINIAFRRVFRYISGENDKNLTIPMSVPVLIKETLPDISPCYDKNLQAVSRAMSLRTFRVLFYIQDAYATDPPKPLNSEVQILMEPEKTYYVYIYTGYVWAIYYNINKYERLKQILEDRGVVISSKEYFVAGYDRPAKLFDRHNEIWIEAYSNDVARICRKLH